MSKERDTRTASDRILSLSATVQMPPYRWHNMRPHCRTCARRDDRDGHRWPSFDRDEWRERGAEEMGFSGGTVMLLFPLSLIWIPQPHCFMHEVGPEWDGVLRGPDAFGVQDLSWLSTKSPLSP